MFNRKFQRNFLFAIHVSAGSGLLLALDLKMNGIIRPDLIGIPDFDGRPVQRDFQGKISFQGFAGSDRSIELWLVACGCKRSKCSCTVVKFGVVTIIFKACHTADNQIIRCLIDDRHMDKHKFIAFCRDRPVISFGFYVAVHRDLNAIVCGGLVLLIDLFGGVSCLLRCRSAGRIGRRSVHFEKKEYNRNNDQDENQDDKRQTFFVFACSGEVTSSADASDFVPAVSSLETGAGLAAGSSV